MSRFLMEQNDQASKKQTVYAPQLDTASAAPLVISVELEEDEEVEWQWTHFLESRSAVTGYTIIKKTVQRE